MRLRPYKIDDAELMATLANNPKIANNLTDQFPSPYGVKQAIEFIENTFEFSPQRVFCIEVDGSVAGTIALHLQSDVFRKNAELGYWIAEEYWGRGIMTEALKEITKYGFEQFDLLRIFARPYGSNLGSQKALQKAGFILESRIEKNLVKNGELQDELVYSIRK